MGHKMSKIQAIVVRGGKTEEELKKYIEHIKRVYGFSDDEIIIVDTNRKGYEAIIKDIRAW